MTYSRWALVGVGALLLIALSGCRREEPILGQHPLWTQDGRTVDFPRDFRGEVLLVAFFYVQCPDICPMIAERMRQIWEALPETTGVRAVMISFDPARDTPERLREFAEAHQLPQPGFVLASGRPEVVEALVQLFGVVVQKTPTEFTDGTPIYFFSHSDVLFLVDGAGRIRKQYSGTEAPIAEVVRDVQQLREEL
ncbi:MAG: SCO family protein [Candidatus Kapabacteria bacterium]|nr:SCO family protein [Candidatus Kapabacteria bacterium]MDW8012235.1 SCO family protein [Bacteroidota bacterium]